MHRARLKHGQEFGETAGPGQSHAGKIGTVGIRGEHPNGWCWIGTQCVLYGGQGVFARRFAVVWNEDRTPHSQGTELLPSRWGHIACGPGNRGRVLISQTVQNQGVEEPLENQDAEVAGNRTGGRQCRIQAH